MIYSVAAVNPKNEVLNMYLTNPEKSGLNVKNVTGVSPIGGEIYITPFASVDGGVYSGSRVPSRNIVLTLGMYPEELPDGKLGSIEESRLKTYNFFRIKEDVELVFITDHRALSIKGHVESNEVEIFSDHEEAVISVLCADPWFRTIGNPDIGSFGTRGRFEFSFESYQFGETYPELLEFGDISIDTRFVVPYNGDIATGFRMSITFFGEKFHNIYIYDMDTRETMTIYSEEIETITERALDDGDEILISTVSGNKTAYLLRDGLYINILGAIDKNSDWFQLKKGNNTFAFASDFGYQNIGIQIMYNESYAGI